VRKGDCIAGGVGPAQAGQEIVHEVGPAVLGKLVELGWESPKAGPTIEVRHERRVRRHTVPYPA
jgi:hypothetical protein